MKSCARILNTAECGPFSTVNFDAGLLTMAQRPILPLALRCSMASSSLTGGLYMPRNDASAVLETSEPIVQLVIVRSREPRRNYESANTDYGLRKNAVRIHTSAPANFVHPRW